VKAKELRSGVEQSIEVMPQYGLTDKEVEHMLLDSITHAKDDMQQRALVEARTEGKQLLEATEKFLVNHASLITSEEMTATAAAIQALQLALTMTDTNLIHAKTEALNEVTKPFTERAMDKAVSEALKGKTI
jgi:molecular chaperone HscA